LSPTRRAGNSSRKLPARTSSTSWHSAGEALCTDTARGRLLVVAIATIFVPLPRRVGPTAKPPFWRSRKWHPRMPRLGSTDRAHGGAAPVAAAPVPASHSVPIVEPAVTGLERRISFGQFTPLRPGAQHPEHTMQDGACVVPWTTTPIGPA